ncbi:hypothetical protein G4B88_023361 [Cannabis sativa]|uniref:Uncharacterized protein n=1 Tax=Cannabis sativa TaxID=3483 RepID=A0A7J6I0Q3_CANSA|nr:hypothetical protein G4B88_023361 [Cannabis sativa]
MALELFSKKAFRHEFSGSCSEELVKLSYEILKKCLGLPLAIRAIAVMLICLSTSNLAYCILELFQKIIHFRKEDCVSYGFLRVLFNQFSQDNIQPTIQQTINKNKQERNQQQ